MKPIVSCAALCLFASPLHAQQPDAGEIMRAARMSATLAKVDKGLVGRMQRGSQKVPLNLFLMGGDIQFQFTKKAGDPEVFHMQLGEESCNLFKIANNKRVYLSAKELVSPIEDTDITYEDLSLRFLYWPQPEFEGAESVAGHECYRIRIERPKGDTGKYEVVYVWVHQKYGAFMQIRGHNKQGVLIKEFQVENVMKIDDETWTLEKMQVSSHDEKTGRRASITNLIFEQPKRKAPRGLR